MNTTTRLFSICADLGLELSIEVTVDHGGCTRKIIHNNLQSCKLVIVKGAMVATFD